MLSASETDRTTVEARPRAEAEQLLEDNLQLKRHKLEEASTCDGVVKLIKRYDRDRHGVPQQRKRCPWRGASSERVIKLC